MLQGFSDDLDSLFAKYSTNKTVAPTEPFVQAQIPVYEEPAAAKIKGIGESN